MPSFVTAYLETSSRLIYELPSSGRIVQSMLFSALSSESRELSKELHDLGRKLTLGTPYSVSCLTTAKDYVRGIYASVPKGGEIRATFKLLRDEYADPLSDGLFNTDLEVNGVPVYVKEVKVARRSYEELLLSSPVASRVTFKLMTNTLLGRRFPPSLTKVLERPLAAWNANAPPDMRISASMFRKLELAEPTIPSLVREARIQLWFGKERIIRTGWLGELSYDLRRLPSFLGKIMSGLMRFSEFSGVGRRTTMGFGVVKVILR